MKTFDIGAGLHCDIVREHRRSMDRKAAEKCVEANGIPIYSFWDGESLLECKKSAAGQVVQEER